MRGTTQDLTAIPIRRAVVLLAVPTVLEMSMESLFAVVDIFFVSKLGPAAVAAVGLTESMLSLAYAVAMGLGAGATAIIARRTGEKDADGAASAAVQAILVAIVIAGVLGTAGALLLGAMGATSDVVDTGAPYTAVMLGGSVTIVGRNSCARVEIESFNLGGAALATWREQVDPDGAQSKVDRACLLRKRPQRSALHRDRRTRPDWRSRCGLVRALFERRTTDVTMPSEPPKRASAHRSDDAVEIVARRRRSPVEREVSRRIADVETVTTRSTAKRSTSRP